MSRRIVFHDLTEFRHLYWEGWPEARIARYFRVSRPVVRRMINSDRFLVEERGITERRANTSAASAARRRSCASRAT